MFMKLKEIEKQIYSSEDKELVMFIRDNFEQISPLSDYKQIKNKCKYKNNINTLEKLDNRSINIGLARMASIKEAGDLGWLSNPMRLIILIIATLTTILTIYLPKVFSLLLKMFPNLPNIFPFSFFYIDNDIISVIVALISLLFIIGVSSNITKTIKESRDKRMTSSYFTELLSRIKEDNKNKEEEGDIYMKEKNIENYEFDYKNVISELNETELKFFKEYLSRFKTNIVREVLRRDILKLQDLKEQLEIGQTWIEYNRFQSIFKTFFFEKKDDNIIKVTKSS